MVQLILDTGIKERIPAFILIHQRKLFSQCLTQDSQDCRDSPKAHPLHICMNIMARVRRNWTPEEDALLKKAVTAGA